MMAEQNVQFKDLLKLRKNIIDFYFNETSIEITRSLIKVVIAKGCCVIVIAQIAPGCGVNSPVG